MNLIYFEKTRTVKFFRRIKRAISLPYSLLVNLRLFPLKQAFTMPIWVKYSTRLVAYRGSIHVSPGNRVYLGFDDGDEDIIPKKSQILIAPHASLVFEGKAWLNSGINIRLDEGGTLRFGDRVTTNRNVSFRIVNNTIIGEDSMFGTDIVLRDYDGHSSEPGVSGTNPIIIGKHTWVGSYSYLAKGAFSGEGSIIAAHSVVTRSSNKSKSNHVLIAGNPGIIKRQSVTWER